MTKQKKKLKTTDKENDLVRHIALINKDFMNNPHKEITTAGTKSLNDNPLMGDTIPETAGTKSWTDNPDIGDTIPETERMKSWTDNPDIGGMTQETEEMKSWSDNPDIGGMTPETEEMITEKIQGVVKGKIMIWRVENKGYLHVMNVNLLEGANSMNPMDILKI
jgi:hypothetical protein